MYPPPIPPHPPAFADRNVLKVKQWLDAEAVVVGHKNAPSTANLPTVKVQALNAPNADPSTTFDLSVSREGTATLPTLPVGHHCHIPVQTDL